MPLPFLTADRAFDEAAEDVALPFDDRDRWRRPYRPGPWRVGVAALWSCCSPRTCCSRRSIIALAGTCTGAGVVLGIARRSSSLCALRLLRVGVWVSARGLRRVGFLHHASRCPGSRSAPCARCSSRCAGWGCPAPCRARR